MDSETNEAIPNDATTIVAPSGKNHTHTVIFLHGRDDFGSDLAQYFFDSKASDGRSLAEIYPSVRWVFPTAKLQYSAQRDFEFSNSSFAEALKGEEIISQWFDVWDITTPEDKEDLMIPGLKESVGQILEIIKEEAQEIPLERIILGGISQGCATAILTLLSSGMDLGGFIGWYSWLPFQKRIECLPTGCLKSKDDDANIKNLEGTLSSLSLSATQTSSLTKTLVFMAHSRDDETVPFAQGKGLEQTIELLGHDVIWKDYEDGGHWIQPKHGVDDMVAFLEKVMAI
ncbi:Alpha/Beta hydrolase protein [Halenospora varia]|nr:Alpha/Beta hydrolase protein [Halenospora varia]